MVMRGGTQPLTVSFYDEPDGDLETPTDIELVIELEGTTVHTALLEDIETVSLGRYRYEWAVPEDADPGQYTAIWSALLPDQVQRSYGYSSFTVSAVDPAIPGFGGCLWPLDPACLSAEWSALDPGVQDRAHALASAALSRLTAYRVGNCPIKVRPQPQDGICGLSGVFHPVNWNGTWSNNGLSHRSPRDLELPPPITRVDEIVIDGVVQDLDDFTVSNQNVITYVGADDGFAWPRTQNMGKPATEEGTFSITYLNSRPVDSNGAYAAGLLAMEFAKACSGDKKCRLPSGVTNIARAGVNIEVVTGAFPDGITSIREVDTYISQWNPRGRTRSTLFDPGAPRHRIEA